MRMAAVPGTSGSSGGGGDLSSNKRSRMNSNNQSNQESLGSDQPGCVSVMRVQPVLLKCVACEDYPPMEVFKCHQGHLVCNKCIANLRRCPNPNCRAVYTKKIRSRVSEADLDGMTFNCRFKNSGCLRSNLRRHQRTAHEIQCDHNPSPLGFNICGPFVPYRVCKFRIEPNSIIQDPEHAKDVIEHLTRHTHDGHFKTIKIGKETSFRFLSPCMGFDPYVTLALFEVFDSTSKTVGYYVLIERSPDWGRETFSFAVVGLNCSPVDLNGGNRHSDKITVKFSIKAKSDPNKVAKDGDECVPDLNWTIKSTYLDNWKKIMMTPIEDQPQSSFSLPISFFKEYYRQEDGRYEMSVRFGPLVD